MPAEPETLIVVMPTLFSAFVERRTRGQRHRDAVARIKYSVKWLLNWKGFRNR
jgi:hypothetical protein